MYNTTTQTLKRYGAMVLAMVFAFTLLAANSATVRADQPVISNFEVNPSTFNPNTQSSQISFSVNQSGKVGLEIHEGSNPVKTLAIRQSVSAGTHSYVWDGTDDNGQPVDAGTYRAQLLFYGDTFALFEDSLVTVEYGSTSQPSDVVTNDYAYPNPFDSRLEYTRIYFTLEDSVDVLDLTIEKNGQHVVTLLDGVSKAKGSYYVTWNGRDKNNVVVLEGEYKYMIHVEGDFGSYTEYGYVDVNYGSGTGVGPTITSDYASPSPFDPNSTSTYIYYTTDVSSDVTVEIYDGAYLVDVLQDHDYEQSGTHSIRWDGRNSNNDVVAPDTYTYRIEAENAYGTDYEEGSVVVDYEISSGVENPVLSNAYASPELFDPTEGEDTDVHYHLNTCAYVTVKVYDKSNNNLVDTLNEFDYQCEGNHVITWDGRDDNHDIVSDGDYEIKITANNSEGSDQEEVTVDVLDDNGGGEEGPNVTNVDVDVDSFDPEDGEEIEFTYELDECAYVTVRVYDEDDDLIIELLDEVYQCEGEHTVTWDGRDEDGDIVSDGDYYFKIIVENNDGSDTDEVWFEVDTDGSSSDDDPEITRVEVDPEVFDPFDEDTELSFRLNTCADVTIEIRDEDNDLVREIIDDRRLCSGTHDYDWDGEDEGGDKVRQDDYEFYIRAENNDGTDIARADVEVDYNGHSFPEGDRCAGYLDVSENDPYCPAIEYVKSRGIFDGYPDGMFRPYQAINRAEATKVIVVGFNYPILPADGTNLGFWDVSPWDWYMSYLRTAKQYGIIQGYPDGSFQPARTVNRVELLKIFLESAAVATPTCTVAPYPDTPIQVDTMWYMGYVCYSKMYSLMDPDYFGNFNPAKPMTRGDVAELFYRYANRSASSYTSYTSTSSNLNDLQIRNVRLSDYIVDEGEGLRIYYALDESAEVTIEILDDDKDEIRTLIDELYRGSGSHSVSWDGDDDDNDEVKEGYFYVRIEAENNGDSDRVDIRFEIEDGYSGGDLRVTYLEVSDDVFDPDTEEVEISFRITEDADVTIRVYDDDNDLVREIWDDRDKDEGTYEVDWDGTDDDDDILPDGDYTIRVIAENSSDSDTDEVEVEIDR